MSKRLPRYSIRKLTIGAASVLIGVAFAGAVNSGTVKAADAGQAAQKVEEKSQPAISADKSESKEAKTDAAKAAAPKAESKLDKQVNASANKPEQAAQPLTKTEHDQAIQSKATAESQKQDTGKAPDPKASTKAPAKAANSTQSSAKADPTSKINKSQEAADQTKPNNSKKPKTDKIDQTVLKKLAKDAKASDVKIKDEKLKSEAQYQERTITVRYLYGNGTGMDSNLTGQTVWDDAILNVYYINTGTAEHPVWKFDSSYSQNGYTNGYKIVKGSWASLPTNSSDDLFVSAPDITKNGSIYIPTVNEDKDGNFTGNSSNEFVNPDYSGSTSNGSSIAFTDQADSFASQTSHTIYYEKRSEKYETFTVKFVDDDDLDDHGDPKLIFSGSWRDNHGYWPSWYWAPLDRAFQTYDQFPKNPANNSGNYYFAGITSDKADPSVLRQSGDKHFAGPDSIWKHPNCRWTDDQADSVNGATFTIHLKHKINTTSSTSNITRTILVNENLPGGRHYSVSQKVTFTHTTKTEAVTGQLLSSTWEATTPTTWDAYSFDPYTSDPLYDITITDSSGKTLKDDSGNKLRSLSKVTVTHDTKSQNLTVTITRKEIHFTINVVDKTSGTKIASVEANNVFDGGWSGLNYLGDDVHSQYYFVGVESDTKDPDIAKVLHQSGGGVFHGANSAWWNPNWSWKDVSHPDAPDLTDEQIAKMIGSTFTIYVKHKTVNITFNNPEIDRTYTGQVQTIPDGISFQAKSDNDEVHPSSNPNNISLTKDDFSFADENGNVLTSAPTNAGTYHLILNDHGLAKFKACNSNFNWNYDPIVYIINKAEGQAKLSGSNSRDYNGSAVTTNDINANGSGTPITVTISIPSIPDRAAITYVLQDDDYSWAEESAPINAGTYTINLNKANILQHLQAKIAADTDWRGNVDLKDTDLSGSATFTINKIAGTVSLSGNDGKTYDGTTGTIDPSKASFTAQLLNGKTLQMPTGSNALTADDFAWEGGTAPIQAGSYQIILKQSGIDKLQAANPNYNLTFTGGHIVYTINKAQAAVTLSGNDGKTADGTAATINPDKAHWQLPTGLQLPTDLTAADFQWENAAGQAISAPSQAGTYYIHLNDSGLQKFAQANSNYQVSVTGAIAYVITETDNPVAPVTPVGPDNQEEQEDLIFVTPTGQVVLRVPNGISGLANHDLTQAQVINLINKYLPQGWQLPTGFTAKEIQVNGLSSFVTVVPAKTQTTVYFVLDNGKILKKTTWIANAGAVSPAAVSTYAKKYEPRGYYFVELGQAHSVELGKQALFITVAPIKAKQVSSRQGEQKLTFITSNGLKVKTVKINPAIAPKQMNAEAFLQPYLPKGYKISQKQLVNPVKMNNQEISVIVVPDKEQK